MKFLIDRCAGRRVATWLRTQGHNVVESYARGPDPGDRVLLNWATSETRILVTIDTDFGELIFAQNQPHAGLVRLPDVPATQRIDLMAEVLNRYPEELESGAVITVRGGRIRIARSAVS